MWGYHNPTYQSTPEYIDPETSDEIRLTFDGCYFRKTEEREASAWAGYLARSTLSNKNLACGTEPIPIPPHTPDSKPYESGYAEFAALREGLLDLVSNGHTGHVIIQGDAEGVLDVFHPQKPSSPNGKTARICSDIMALLESFDSYQIQYLTSETNPAHQFAHPN